MSGLVKAYIEIGIIKDLQQQEIISEDEMNLAIKKIIRKFDMEVVL